MSNSPVFLDPLPVPHTSGTLPMITDEVLATVAERCKAVIEIANAHDGYVPKSDDVSTETFRWEDVRRVLYAVHAPLDGNSIEAFASLRDGRLIRLFGEFPRSAGGRPKGVQIRIWSIQDWVPFLGALKTSLDYVDSLEELCEHVETCGTIIEILG